MNEDILIAIIFIVLIGMIIGGKVYSERSKIKKKVLKILDNFRCC